MQMSVVIPTSNRSKSLKDCLRALIHQDLPESQFEVIVVDDGSRDETRAVVQKFQQTHVNFSYVYQKKQGICSAKNKGVFKAKGQIILFLQDDVIASPSLLTEHLRFHLRYPGESQVVQGSIMWHSKLTLTPFMKWYAQHFSLVSSFFYPHKLSQNQNHELLGFSFLTTMNASFKKTLLEKFPFDSAFANHSLEDFELSYRLCELNKLQLLYNSQAVGYHDHAVTEEYFIMLMRNIGASIHVFLKKYPNQNFVPSDAHLNFCRIQSLAPLLIFGRLVRDMSQGYFSSQYYNALMKRSFFEGFDSGISEDVPL